MRDTFLSLGLWCPLCGVAPGEECHGPVEHDERFNESGHYWPLGGGDRAAELAHMPYRDYLNTPEWNEKRLLILERAGHKCEQCGGTHKLQVHHKTYERRGDEWPSDLIALCDPCHVACHPSKRLNGAPVSYGAYVQACLDERRRKTIGRADWDYAAVKYANDNFADYPEERVVEVLREMRWPDRPVTVGEVHKVLKARVSPSERERWLKEYT